MRVIGAAVARTGTLSLKAALERLGYRTYHFEEAIDNFERGDLNALVDHMTGTKLIDWGEFLKDYDATADLPLASYYKEIMAAFPDAPVILTVRDPEEWWNSIVSLDAMHQELLAQVRFLPRFEAQYQAVTISGGVFLGGPVEKEGGIAKFKEYIAEVKATVPANRLLVFSVADGWGPLCEFLGEPVPDEPFPHENVGMQKAEAIVLGHLVRDLQATLETSDDPELRAKATAWLEKLAAL
jgi:hypothetical protein